MTVKVRASFVVCSVRKQNLCLSGGEAKKCREEEGDVQQCV